jgi:RNA polymerase sigma-70 factor (ECF subfamily)
VAQRYVVERLPPEAPLAFVGELTLACALTQSVPGALETFERQYAGSMRAALTRRLRGSGIDVDDALQLLLEKLLMGSGEQPPTIAKYTGRGSLGAWLHIVADRHALKMIRRAAPAAEPIDDAIADRVVAGLDPELAYLRTVYTEPFRRALSAAIASLSARDRSVLRLQLISGLDPEEIARLCRVHRTTVIRWLVQARRALLSATRRSLMTALSLNLDELSSVIRLVRSELPWILRSHLREEIQ